jgi:uncharacterized protein (TIGR02687 family)
MLDGTKIKVRLEEKFTAPKRDFYARRIVFWHDCEEKFAELFDELEIDGVKKLTLTRVNNFYAKKLLSKDDITSDYLVYIPLELNGEDNWLSDIEYYSETFSADFTSNLCEELNIPATAELKKAVGGIEKFFNKQNKEKFKRLGGSYFTVNDFYFAVFSVLCGCLPNGNSIIISVLSADADGDNTPLFQFAKYKLVDIFWDYVKRITGYARADTDTPFDFAAHLLLTSLSYHIKEKRLSGLERYISVSNIHACYQIVHEWAVGSLCGRLFDLCREVEEKCGLFDRFSNPEKFTLAELTAIDTFPCIDEVIILRLLAALNSDTAKPLDIVSVCDARRTKVWQKEVSGYYDCLYYAAKMREFYLENRNAFHETDSRIIFEDYTKKYYLLDTYYRKFHLAFAQILKDPSERLDDAIKNLADRNENLYKEWFLGESNAMWLRAAKEDYAERGIVFGISAQSNFYTQHVKSLSKTQKVFVIISDGLRYDVAAELTEELNGREKGSAVLTAAEGVFPSVTKFGMAALLPHDKISAVYAKESVDVLIDGKYTSGTEARGAILTAAHKESLAIRYDDLIRLKKDDLRAATNGKDIIYIYHDCIDNVGEHNDGGIFEACETAVTEIVGLVRRLIGDLTASNIIVTADHGFLYTYRALAETDKVSVKNIGGKIYESGRRYALTDTDGTTDFLLPVNVGKLYDGAPMFGFSPEKIVRIAKGGEGGKYVHGGLSLQEIAVPIVIYKNIRADSKKYVAAEKTELRLISDTRKIMNLAFKLEFQQTKPIIGKVSKTTFKLFFTDLGGNKISDEQTIIADKTSTDPAERIFRTGFALKSLSYDRNAVYKLVITSDLCESNETEFTIDIAFTGFFD